MRPSNDTANSRLGVVAYWWTRIVLCALGLALSATAASAQDTPDYFRQNCMSCHTVGGGRLSGPDLKNVLQRRDRAWLAKFIRDPQAVVDGGDPYARDMVKAARGVIMPKVATLTAERVEAILDLLEAESTLEQSQFAGVQVSNEPFTAADVQRGRELFRGNISLANGAPACHSCHTAPGIGGLGGGGLGPDLTLVYERLDGRKGLSAWLSAPGTNTMQPLFKNNALEASEIHALAAYFEDAAQHPEDDRAASRVVLLLLGLGGAVLMFVLIEYVWRGRLRGVRRPLVAKSSLRGNA